MSEVWSLQARHKQLTQSYQQQEQKLELSQLLIALHQRWQWQVALPGLQVNIACHSI